MKTITNHNIKIDKPTAITIGKFDGLHRGHMSLIDELKNVAAQNNLATAVLTFAPHPIAFFTKTHMPLILDPGEKAELFQELGIDFYIQYKFDKNFADTLPEDFLEKILYGQLNAKMLVASADYRFGKGGAGDVYFAQKVGDKIGLKVHIIPDLLTHRHEKISSNLLRQLVVEKNFGLIDQLCNRPFSIRGFVDKKGTITPHPDKILPPAGDYEVIVENHGKTVVTVKNGTIKVGIKHGENVVLSFI